MNIALFGYGKMGKAIEQIALERGHNIALIIDAMQDNINFNNVDVVIDFSTPETAVHNISLAFNNGIPVVSGTTGWLEQYDKVLDLCQQKNGSFIYASNFSLGVNLFFELNTYLAKLLHKFDYEARIIETHHTQKIDAPSGTAISLAEQLLPYSNKKKWALDTKDEQLLNITANRLEDVPGTHQIIYESEVDEIEIKHTAKSRKGFALGAVLAAEYIKDKSGIFTMRDVLAIEKKE